MVIVSKEEKKPQGDPFHTAQSINRKRMGAAAKEKKCGGAIEHVLCV